MRNGWYMKKGLSPQPESRKLIGPLVAGMDKDCEQSPEHK